MRQVCDAERLAEPYPQKIPACIYKEIIGIGKFLRGLTPGNLPQIDRILNSPRITHKPNPVSNQLRFFCCGSLRLTLARSLCQRSGFLLWGRSDKKRLVSPLALSRLALYRVRHLSNCVRGVANRRLDR